MARKKKTPAESSAPAESAPEVLDSRWCHTAQAVGIAQRLNTTATAGTSWRALQPASGTRVLLVLTEDS